MKKILSLIFALTLTCVSQAQVNTYPFTQSSGVYNEIAGDVVIASATGVTGAAGLDDANYTANAIPFSFKFNGIAYTTYTVNSNGFITFGTTNPTTTTYTPISSTTAYAGAVAPHGRDLIGTFGTLATATNGSTTLTGVASFAGVVAGRIITGTGIPANTTIVSFDQGAQTIELSAAATASSSNTAYQIAAGSIVAGTTGSIGSRVHTIQWKNFRRYTTSGTVENINFQIKLYETTNDIEFIYGSYTGGTYSTTSGQTGLRGATNTDFNNRTTTTDWSATTAGGTNTSTMTFTAAVKPASGQTYKWDLPDNLADDVAATAIVSPSPGSFDGEATIAPKGTFANLGSANQNTPFNVVCTISPGGYSSTKSMTLNSGESKTVTFDSTFVPTIGTDYTITIYSTLASDQNRNNDTLRATSKAFAFTYGSDSGYYYANSNATNRPSYPNYCWKDTSGSISLVLNAVTQPGALLTGSLDDGYFRMSLNDVLLAFGMDTTDKAIKFNNVCWDSLFVNTNGIIGLTQQFGTYSINDFNIDGAQVANNAILAWWKDFNFSSIVSSGGNRLSYKVSGSQLIITYSTVQCFAPTTDWASFQVVLEIVDCGGDNSNWRVSVADSLNGTSGSLIQNYNAQLTAPTGSATVFRNWVMGWSGTGAVNVYGGFISSGNPFPASPVTQVNLQRAVFNSDGSGVAIEYGPSENDLDEFNCITLNLALALEGLQSNPTPRARDTVTVYLRDASSAPYTVLESKKVFLDSASTYRGVIAFESGAAKVNSNEYYIVIQHRNSIRSWSQTVSQSGGVINYDFTTSPAQTYGSNAVVVNGLASFYSGDVNQDGFVDASDASLIDNDAFNFVGGDYVVTDLNWDGFVDASDASLVDNNAFNFVGEITPPGALRIAQEPVFKTDFARPTRIEIVPDPTLIGVQKIEQNIINPDIEEAMRKGAQ